MSKSKIQAVQVIANQGEVKFGHPHKDIYTAATRISSCGWVDTGEGAVLLDTLLYPDAAESTLEKIHETAGNIEYIVFTHGHLDHISGAKVFQSDDPKEIIANEYLPLRLDKYKMLAQHRNRVSAQQFNLPERKISAEQGAKIDFVYPTKTFLGEYTFKLGNKTFECRTARAETDDYCWVWIPETGTAAVGDLIIRSFPNIGNPWKPTRFTLDWAKALEEVRAKEPEILLCGGAGIAIHGEEALDTLDVNIEAIRNLHDQVVKYINEDMHISEMIHAVKLPDHLAKHPRLQFSYSRPEFLVYNAYRWYHGYFDGNPANLIPRPEKEVSSAIMELIGNPNAVLENAKKYLENGQAQLGLQVLDVLLQAQPDNPQARKLRVQLLETLAAEDRCLMSRNAWVYFIEKDRAFLDSWEHAI